MMMMMMTRRRRKRRGLLTEVCALTSGVSRKRSARAPRSRYSFFGSVLPNTTRCSSTCSRTRAADNITRPRKHRMQCVRTRHVGQHQWTYPCLLGLLLDVLDSDWRKLHRNQRCENAEGRPCWLTTVVCDLTLRSHR
eukprot:39514-Rhodomonas_salina.3